MTTFDRPNIFLEVRHRSKDIMADLGQIFKNNRCGLNFKEIYLDEFEQQNGIYF